jgi:hypothetical protein
MNNKLPKKKLSAQELMALKIFFWFSLAFTLLLLKVDPSKETVSLVAGVIFLGFRLFLKKTDSVSASNTTTTPETVNTDAAHWSKISIGQWLFIIFCTFATPIIFGARIVNAAYFIMCWLGLFLGCASIITIKIFKDDQQKKNDRNE